MANKIQLRRDTASNWTSSNPTLSQGEQGYETDTGKLKIGDGSTAWTSLGYSFVSSNIGGATGVEFDDNVKVKFGSSGGNELEIYTDGTSSYITESGSSHLNIQGQEIKFKNASGTSLMTLSASQMEVFHSGSKKLETYSGGIQTTGTVNVNNAYTLPTADGTNGQVLTTNGSGAVTFADASGGGATDLNDLTPCVSNTTTDNYGIGRDVLGDITTGIENVAFGALSGQYITTGSSNTLYGRNAGRFVTTGSGNVGIGLNAATGSNLNKLTGDYNVGIGYRAGRSVASTDNNTAIGYNADNSGNPSGSTAIGSEAVAAGSQATALTDSYASGADSLAAAIANNTSSYGATGANSIAIGELAKSTNTDSVAIGSGASATGSESMALHKGSLASGLYSTALGNGAYATATNSIALGTSAYAYGAGGAALGRNARSYGEYAVGLANSYATNSNSLAGAIGTNSSSYGALHDNGVALGYQAVTTADKQIALGSSTAQVKVSGAYTLPTADGSANQVLQTDGSGALSFATVSGGGGDPDLYRDNASSSTTPTASGTNAVAIGTNAIASNTESVALGGDTLSSGYKSFGAVIGNSNAAYGATGWAAISIGLQSRATASDSIALGPSAYASGSKSLSLGYASTASGTNSIAVGNSTSNAYLATSFGEYALSESQGKYSYASGRFGSTEGSAQTGTYVLRADTTDATSEALTTRNNGGVQSDNQVNLPNNSCYGFTGTVIAREDSSSTNDFAVWEIKGGAVRAGSASTTALGSYNINKISESTGAANWSIALSADTTNGAVAITVTGEASHSIRWVATVNTTEVIY